jgi:geranylgeranyl pyrophosphate synthase
LELANEQQGLELKEWFSKEVANNSEKVQAVLALFRTLKVEENVEAMMNTYYHKAYQDLQKLSFNNQKMEPLQAFVGFLAGREH